MTTTTISLKEDAQVPGQWHLRVEGKPAPDEVGKLLEFAEAHGVQSLAVYLPAVLATEYRFVQLLGYFRKKGKALSLHWTDAPPSGPAATVLQSII
jgi:hypothetical protein